MGGGHKTHYNLSESDKEHELNKKLTASADFQGPIKNRHCTDPLHTLLLLAAWALMTAVGIKSVQNGQIGVLQRGYDWQGNICTHKSGKPFFLPVNLKTMGVCVESCPTTTDFSKYYCIGGVTPTALTLAALVQNGYCLFQFETEEIMNRCYVTNVTALSQYGLADAYKEHGGSYLSDFYGDIIEARAYIFGIGLGCALLLGFLWTYLLRIPALLSVTIWTMCFAVNAFLVVLGIVMYKVAEGWKDDIPQTHSSTQIWGAKGLAIFFLVLAGLWLCLLLFLRKSINLAIGLVIEAAKALETMPLIVLYPVAQAAGLIAFLVPWVFWSVFVASLGEFETTQFSGTNGLGTTIDVLRFQYGSQSKGYAWYMLFVLLWTSQFIIALGQITMALAFSTWYFTRDKASITSLNVFRAATTTLYYHFGTAAHGSLVVAVVQFIRAVVTYFQRKAEQASKAMPQSVAWLIRIVGCCVQCCLWCVEKCLKFINKNAYIQTAIYGTPFCTSAKKAFFLIARNISRIAAVSLVSEFVIVIGKLFISMCSGGVAYYLIVKFLDKKVSSPIPPTILVVILAWFTAQMFCEVLSMCVATLLQCFIADEEMFEKNPAERFASAELCSYIGQNGGVPMSPRADPDRSSHV